MGTAWYVSINLKAIHTEYVTVIALARQQCYITLTMYFQYVRVTQHTCKYMNPIQGYMFRLSRINRHAFLIT
jgi:hypothetical protein